MRGQMTGTSVRRALCATLFASVASCSTLPPITTGSPASTSGGSGGTSSAGTVDPGISRDYARIERDVISELNAVRTNPAAYAANLEALLSTYNGTLTKRPGWPMAVRTNEGASAVREAIAALRAQARLNALAANDGLSRAARDLAIDQGRTGNVGHTASDGSSPSSRISRYGTWGVSTAENVDYGQMVSGRDVVEDWLIDDGVPDRGHRRNIFDPSARVVGVACGPHPRYGVVCVMDQAGAFTSK
jgi:uncharacterized protein YkwD